MTAPDQGTRIEERLALVSWLRQHVDSLCAEIEPEIYASFTNYWPVSHEEINSGTRFLLDAVIDSFERDSIAPIDQFIASLDNHWSADIFRADPLVRGLQIVLSHCTTRLSEQGLPSLIPLLNNRFWDLLAMLVERSVLIITGQLAQQVKRHQLGESRLLGLQRVSTAVVSDLDLDQTLSMIVDEARTLLQSDTVAIRMADDNPDILKLLASSGSGDLLAEDLDLPVHGTLCGYVLNHGISACSNDPWSDPRVNQDLLKVNSARSLLIAPLRMRDQVIGVISVSNQSPGAFNEDDQRILELFADQAVTAIENARLYQQAQEQISELEILHQISSVVLSSLDLEQVFKLLYEQVRRLMPADAFLVAQVREEDRYDLEFIVDDGQVYSARRGVNVSPLLRDAVDQERPVIIGDATLDQRYASAGHVGNLERRSRSILTVPLFRGNTVFGLISTQSYTPYEYRERDSRLLLTIANQASIAIEHARLYQQAQNLAIAEERNRLAREIHDTLAQGLVGIILCMESLELSIDETSDKQRAWVERALRLSRSSLDEARRSVSDLRAAPLEGRTLSEAVTSLVSELEQDEDFQVVFLAPSTLPVLSARVEAAMFRIIQEAVTNCRKHAQCSNLEISLEINPEHLQIAVVDDGRGFNLDPDCEDSGRYGLATMRERIHQLGGEFTIESTPGAGTSIRATLSTARATYGETPFHTQQT